VVTDLGENVGSSRDDPRASRLAPERRLSGVGLFVQLLARRLHLGRPSPTRIPVAAAALAVALVLASPATAATRFVDDGGNDNGGANTCLSAALPCKTVGQAVTSAVANDTVQIGPGAYSESVTAPGTKPLAFVGPAAGPGPAPPGGPDPAVHATIASAGAAPALHLQGGGSVTNLRLKGADGVSVGPALQLGTGMSLGTRTYSVTNVVAIGGINGTAGRPALIVTDAFQPGVQIDATVTGGHFSSAATSNSLDVVTLDGANVSGTLISTSIAGTGTGVTNWNGLAVRDGAAGTLSMSTVSGDISGVLVSEGDSQALVTRSTIRVAGFGINVASFSGGTSNAVTVLNSLVVSNPTTNLAAVAVLEFSGNATLTARGSTFVVRGAGPEAGLRLQCTCGPANAVTGDLANSVVRVLDTDSAPTSPDVRVATTNGAASFTASHSSYDTVTTIPGSGTATATPAGSGTNLIGDPLFVDESTGDYTLQAGSQFIERGDAAVVAAGELDAAGAPRAQDIDCDGLAIPDIGAFERPGAAAPCQPPGPGIGGTAGGADTIAPVLDRFTVTNPIFRPPATAAARLPRGTRFRYRLSEDATVRIAIARRAAGRRVGGRCRPPSRRLSGHRRCIRYVRVGALRASGKAGANTLRFAGRIGRRLLRPGRYRARATATDLAGNVSAARRATFRVVR
jgi:hypothetical protein